MTEKQYAASLKSEMTRIALMRSHESRVEGGKKSAQTRKENALSGKSTFRSDKA